MKRNCGLATFILVIALAFVSGCAKKTVLKEESMPKVAMSDVKAPEKSALKPAASDKAEQAKKLEAMEKEKKVKEAQAKKDATAKDELAKANASKGAAAAPSKELYNLTDIHFEFDNYNLKEEERATLSKHANWLNKNKDVKVTIEGHCDEMGNEEYNLALGERRAKVAAKYLIDMGINPERVKTISYGEERPLDPRHNEEGWSKNRRDNFVTSAK